MKQATNKEQARRSPTARNKTMGGKLAGITEIGQMLGVSRQRASQLVASEGFPKPMDRLASGPVWKRSAVEKWAAAQGRELR